MSAPWKQKKNGGRFMQSADKYGSDLGSPFGRAGKNL